MQFIQTRGNMCIRSEPIREAIEQQFAEQLLKARVIAKAVAARVLAHKFIKCLLFDEFLRDD
jgi:hypothetical protein